MGRICTVCLLGLATVGAIVPLGGCHLGVREPLAPLEAPQATIVIDHFPGEPLSGALATAPTIGNPQDALDVRMKVIALERMVVGTGQPISMAARLLVATRGLEPVRPSARITGVVRLLDPLPAGDWPTGGEYGRTITMREALGALPEGVTLRMKVTVDADLWEFMVCRAPESRSVQLAVVREGDYQPPPEQMEEMGPSSRPVQAAEAKPLVRVREMVLLERPVPSAPDRVGIVVPLGHGDSPGGAMAVLIEIRPGNEEEAHVEAVAAAQEDLKLAAGRAAVLPDRLPVGSSESSTLQIALRSLAEPAARRASLVYLAGQTGASLCEQIAMIADETLLAQLSETVLSRGQSLWLTPDALGWPMDRAAFEMLAGLLSSGKLPPELSAVLVSWTGEVGRNSASIEEVSRALATRADFQSRLVGENTIFLEDSSPASRVRAYDWLASRGLAPAGYDPLASPRVRRDALEKALQVPPATHAAGGRS